MLLETAGSDLDGKYIAFTKGTGVSPYNGGVYLSSDYGQSFEKVVDFNWYLNYQSCIKPAVDVEGGKPVVYFPSGSASRMAVYKYKDGVVNLMVTASVSVTTKAFLYCLDKDVVLWVNPGNNSIYLVSGSNLTSLGSYSYLTYMPSSLPKGRRKKGYLAFASYYNNTVTAGDQVFWTKGYTNPTSFTLFGANINNSLPASSSKPASAYFADADISTDGQTVGTMLDGNVGLIVGEGLQGSGYWHYNPRATFVTGSYVYSAGFTLSKNKSFVAFRSSSTSTGNYTNCVSRYSTLVPSTSSFELISTLPAPTLGTYPQYGYYSMSLWANTKGDKLLFKGMSYGGMETPICYSHDAGVTWNRSSYPSSSTEYVVGVDVYRT